MLTYLVEANALIFKLDVTCQKIFPYINEYLKITCVL